jgi:hypothetical protein
VIRDLLRNPAYIEVLRYNHTSESKYNRYTVHRGGDSEGLETRAERSRGLDRD